MQHRSHRHGTESARRVYPEDLVLGKYRGVESSILGEFFRHGPRVKRGPVQVGLRWIGAGIVDQVRGLAFTQNRDNALKAGARGHQHSAPPTIGIGS